MTVEQQQCYLGAMGYYTLRRKDGSLAVDGDPGPSTRRAVLDFQKDHGLDPDWLWGPKTEAAVLKAAGAGEVRKPAPVPPVVPGKYKWVDPDDFKCRCGGQFCNGWPAQPSTKTLQLLEQIGEHFQRRIRPHSGCRCKRWNAQWGGSSNSQHLTGHAMDFHLDGVNHQTVYDYADRLLGNSGGLGIYSWGVHIDDRSNRSRWRG